MTKELKVGEIARRTGVSVRTLHFYEEIGLLRPARRSSAGHRLYGREQLFDLQRIRSLVHLGLSLEEVKGCLGDPEFSVESVLELHIRELDESIRARERLRRRLREVARRLESADTVSPELLLRTIEEITMLEEHFTPEQRDRLTRRREELGDAAIRDAESAWAELIAAVRAEMEQGTDPRDPAVRALAGRWKALVDAFTEGDPGLERSLARVWKRDGATLRERHGDAVPTPEMFAYIGRALREG